jgi:hypothetical protein
MSLEINLTNVQSKAVVVSTNQTAVNDGSYTVVANATFTDPSPVEGKGYRVFVRNGTATINSVGYTVGTSIFRLFHSGGWVSYVSLPDNNFVPTTRTINGLDLSTNRTLTASDVGAVATNSAISGATKTKITYDAKGLVTSGTDATTVDIADSSNKRYVTDAQLTVIGNTSNTNSGDNFILSGIPFNANSATGGSPRYYGFSDNANSANELTRRFAIPKSCTLSNFYIRTSGTQPASGSHVFTILKNGVATAITITVPAGSSAGLFNDTTHQVSFTGGDEISIEAVNNASATSSVVVSFSIGVL